MRLVTFLVGGTERLGAVIDGRVIDVRDAADALAGPGGAHDTPALPADMLTLLRLGAPGLDVVRALLDMVDASDTTAPYVYDLSAVRVRAPIPAPGKILCIGRNYREHAAEEGAAIPEEPLVFAKFANTIIGPDDEIVRPPTTRELDYEAELVVVIGTVGKHIPPEHALDHVVGYTIGHDVSARDLQRTDAQWVRAKSSDTFAPLGPALVTRDDVPDPHALDIRLWVNGDLRQNSNTSLMIADIPALIAFISESITLAPGDLIFTGTPAGVGAFRDPPLFLQPGDDVAIEITSLGRLSNRIVATMGGPRD